MDDNNNISNLKFLVLKDFSASNKKDLGILSMFTKKPKFNKIINLRSGEVLECSSIGWWMKIKKSYSNINSVGKSYGYAPSTILIPVITDKNYIDVDNLSTENKILMIPNITKQHMKFFPEIFSFYGDLLSKRTFPPSDTNFLSKIFYSFITYLFMIGINRYLVEGDSWEKSKLNSVENDTIIFDTEIKKLPETEQSFPIFTIYVKSNISRFSSALLCKFFQDIIKFMTPLMIILYIKNFEETNFSLAYGIIYSFALFSAIVFESILLNKYYEIVYNLGINFRCLLASKIYSKMFAVDHEKLSSFPISMLSNFISVDIYRIQDAIVKGTLILSSIFKLCLSAIFLSVTIKLSSITITIIVGLMPILAFYVKFIRKCELYQIILKDRRMKFINIILNGIRLIKFYAWETTFENILDKIRDKEVKRLTYIKVGKTILLVISLCLPNIMLFMSIMLYMHFYPSLDVKTAFSTLAVFQILKNTINRLPESVALFVAAKISYERIVEFLSLPTRKDLKNRKYVTNPNNINISIQISQGYFSFDSDSSPYLQNINFISHQNSLCIITGHNGSGKTSLLKAILNEMCQISGDIIISGEIAYVPQCPWIKNTSIRNNIVLDRPFDSEKYSYIMKICHLNKDIESFEFKDLTDIGEKGVNLSGGQKQRIGLARALYADANIYLIDDTFSALDRIVGINIFKDVFYRDGYLKDKTRILVTHCDSFLEYADQIIFLKDGEITDSGTYNELKNKSNNFRSFLINIDKNTAELKNINDENDNNHSLEPVNNFNICKFNKTKSVIKVEQLVHEKIKFNSFKNYIVASNVVLFTLVVGFNLCSAFSATYSQNIVGIYTSGQLKRNKTNEFFLYTGGILLIQISFLILSSILLAISSYIASKKYHMELIQNLFTYSIRFYEEIPIGRLLNLFSNEISIVDQKLPENIGAFIRSASILLVSIVFITYKIYYIIIPVSVLSMVYYFIQFAYTKTSRQIQRIESISRSPIISHVVDSFQGLSIIKCNMFEDKYIQHFNYLIEINSMSFRMNIYCSRWLSIRLELISILLTLLCCFVLLLSRNKLNITSGDAGFILGIVTSITQILSFLVIHKTDLENDIVSIEKITEFMNLEREMISYNISNNYESFLTNGKIEIINFSCRYKPDLSNTIRNMNCVIFPRQKIGIVGRTGSGKSSLILSLFRMTEFSSGRIEIDGKDISKIPLVELRRSLTIIPQESFIFDGTIKENIDPLKLYNDNAIWDAIEKVQLRNFVCSHPERLEYKLIEDGTNISSGEKQLICLARAILKCAKILVLDEATSNIDKVTDAAIQTIIKREFLNSTVITIAHRIETILDYDKIIVLDKGEIVEFDSPQVLLADKKSKFYDFMNYN